MTRLSNLPTVWSNGLSGVTLAGGEIDRAYGVTLLAALSAYYIGGMILNDACDATIDAQQRPERPIPRQAVSRREAYLLAGLLLGVANGLLCGSSYLAGRVSPLFPGLLGVILTGLIIGYDFWHKHNPWSPLLMALCRFMTYAISASVVLRDLPMSVLVAACVLACYIIGLSLVARQEHLAGLRHSWPLLLLTAPLGYGLLYGGTLAAALGCIFLAWLSYCFWLLQWRRQIRLAVGHLIAGIALWDALLLGSLNADAGLIGFALVAFALTWLAQRRIAGT